MATVMTLFSQFKSLPDYLAPDYLAPDYLDIDIKDSLTVHLIDQVSPLANRMDHDVMLLFKAFLGLGERGWLAPKCPTSLGGLGLDDGEYRQFQSVMARYSGALTFLQTQHQTAASLLLAGNNEALKQAYIPEMVVGKKRVGVGISHLRRQPPPLVAKPVEGGYRLSGEVPWVSGAELFDEFIGAAMLPSGEAVFGLLPLVNCLAEQERPDLTATQTDLTATQTDGGRLVVSEPMALCAVAATNTVRVQLNNWFLADDQVVGARPAGWLTERDRANPLSPLGMIFGCTQAGIDVVMRSLTRRQLDHPIAEQLTTQLELMQAELLKTVRLPKAAYGQKIALRGRAISLMNTAAQAAIISASGAANSLSHPAQRIYRESLLFSISGQTTDGAIASLDSLTP